MVHEGVLTTNSKFFKAACSGNFKEAKERTVRLPEIEKGTFQKYLHFVYTSEIDITAYEEKEAEKEARKRYEVLAQLYLAGCYLMDNAIQNVVIDNLHDVGETTSRLAPAEVIAHLYANTPEGSKVRQYIVDCQLVFATAEDGAAWAAWLKEARSVLPADYFFDMTHRRMEMGGRDFTMPMEKGLCKYHEHDEDTPVTSRCGG